eukprot:Em0021g272a
MDTQSAAGKDDCSAIAGEDQSRAGPGESTNVSLSVEQIAANGYTEQGLNGPQTISVEQIAANGYTEQGLNGPQTIPPEEKEAAANMLESVAPEAEDLPGWKKTHLRSHSAFAGKISTEQQNIPQISCQEADGSAGLSVQTRQASASETNLQSLSSVSPDQSGNTSHCASIEVSTSSHTSLCESDGLNVHRQTDSGFVTAAHPQDCLDSGLHDVHSAQMDQSSKPGPDVNIATSVGVEIGGAMGSVVSGTAVGAGNGPVDVVRSPGVVLELSPTSTKDDVMELIVQLKLQIVALQEENDKLKEVRANMDNDLHELTANLFQEAYKMVDEAKGEKLIAEKRLADASGRIEALQTEVLALKSLLQSPVKVETPAHKAKQKSPFRKSLHFSKKDKSANLPQSSSDNALPVMAPFAVIEHKSTLRGACIQHGEPLPTEFEEFRQWVENISLSRDNPYMARILNTDIKPCLSFANKELSEKVLDAIEQNSLLIEFIPSSSQVVSECALTGPCDKDKHCTHQITVGDSKLTYFISQPCRERIVAVCEFYVYTRHIEKKIVRLDAFSLYWQICRLRAVMSLARLSLQLPEME